MISSNFKVIGFERNPFRYSDSHRAEEKGFGVRHISTRAHTHARPAPEFAVRPLPTPAPGLAMHAGKGHCFTLSNRRVATIQLAKFAG